MIFARVCSVNQLLFVLCVCLRTQNFRRFLEWFLLNKLVFPAVCWSAVSVLCLCHARLGVKCQGAVGAFRSLWSAQLFLHNTQNENNCIIAGHFVKRTILLVWRWRSCSFPHLFSCAMCRVSLAFAGPDYAHQCKFRTAHTLGQTTAEEHQHKPWERKGIGAVGAGDRLTIHDGECALLLSYITIILCSLHVLPCLPLFGVVLHQHYCFPLCRFKVEFYLLKPSASRLHLLQQAQIFPGPERLSEMFPSAV